MATWDSQNTGIATIDFGGQSVAVGVGDTTIHGCTVKTIWYNWGGGYCEPFEDLICNYAPIEVRPSISKIQYKGPNNPTFTDASSTLYVLKDTEVTFKAIPNPPTSNFPSGQPVWSGSSGATGTGQTISVTFGAVSSSASNFKTVIATSGNSSVTVNVIVYSLTGTFNAEAYFYGRSNEKYGLREIVNLGFIASPSVTTQQIGTLRWSIFQGLGSITNDTNLNGAGVFTADSAPGNVKLLLKIENGPSKDLGFLSNSIPIIAPSAGYIVKNPEVPVMHCQNYSSVGFQGFVYLTPKDVSFANLFFKEGYGTIEAKGFYASQDGLEHDPTDLGVQVTSCDIITGCLAFYDTIYTLNWTGPFSSGTLNWPIEWKYGLSQSTSIENYVFFTTGTHSSTVNGQGTATISKANSGTFTKAVSDPTSGPFPCNYPIVSP